MIKYTVGIPFMAVSCKETVFLSWNNVCVNYKYNFLKRTCENLFEIDIHHNFFYTTFALEHSQKNETMESQSTNGHLCRRLTRPENLLKKRPHSSHFFLNFFWLGWLPWWHMFKIKKATWITCRLSWFSSDTVTSWLTWSIPCHHLPRTENFQFVSPGYRSLQSHRWCFRCFYTELHSDRWKSW